MKIIISESQYKLILEDEEKKEISPGKLKKYKQTIDEKGIVKGSKLLNREIYDLVKLGAIENNQPISKEELFYLFPELVKMMNRYKGCNIEVDWYEENYGVSWVYRESYYDDELITMSFSYPNFDNGKVYVENGHCHIMDETYLNGSVTQYIVEHNTFDILDKLNTWGELVEWYETKYLPNTYEILQKQAKEIIEQLRQNKKI